MRGARRYAGRAPVASDGWQDDGDGSAGGEIEAYLQRENDGPQQTPWDGGVRRVDLRPVHAKPDGPPARA